jgi:CRISPR-associated protein Csb1
MSDALRQFDGWLTGEDVAALTARQLLQSVDGADSFIFPPTFAAEKSGEKGDYNIDHFDGSFGAEISYERPGGQRLHTELHHDQGRNVCLVNSVGAEANRVEIIFHPEKLGGRYAGLIPQITVRAGSSAINLIEAGHRAGDALVRFTSVGERLFHAFQNYLTTGNAEPLAKIAPTSIVFGVWDSRGTQAKFPRVFRSVVRAYDVRRCRRSAQFNRAVKYVESGLIEEELDKGSGDDNPLSREGFKDNPAGHTHGGVVVEGEIRREMTVNLSAIRRLRVPNTPERALTLQRYILGLSLVAATTKNAERYDLREGCHLKNKPGHTMTWNAVPYDGEPSSLPDLTAEAALDFAKLAADAFGVAPPEVTEFDQDAANKWLRLDKKEQDKRRRENPMTKQFGPESNESGGQPGPGASEGTPRRRRNTRGSGGEAS